MYFKGKKIYFGEMQYFQQYKNIYIENWLQMNKYK